MGFIKEFKEFAMKGNVMDMAVGVIIGGAFGKIVSSLVDDVLMPLIGVITGGVDFTGLAVKVGDAELKYGMFIQNIIDLSWGGIFFPLAILAIIFEKPLGIEAITPWIVLIAALLLTIAFEMIFPKNKFHRHLHGHHSPLPVQDYPGGDHVRHGRHAEQYPSAGCLRR